MDFMFTTGAKPLPAALQLQAMKRITIMSVVLIVLLPPHLINAERPTQCGPGLKNPCNDPNLCCNAKGRCGSTDSDCGARCQSGNCFFTLKNTDSNSKAERPTQCGPGLKNPCKDPSLCCNAKGRCGSADSDCGDGCQSGNCFFTSRNDDSNSKAERPTQCGPGLKNPCKDPSLCCNSKGRCGSTDSDCGDGCQSGNCFFALRNGDSNSKAERPTQCGPGLKNPCKDASLCCNSKGRCGSTDSDCGDGCQSGNCFFALRNGDSNSKAERPTQCGPGLKNPCKGSSLCCNAKGRCGSTDSDCGDGCQSGNCFFALRNGDSNSKAERPTQCGPGLKNPCKDTSLCCNAKGRCGSTDSDCGDGCQSGNCFFALRNGDSNSKAERPTQCGPGLKNPCKDASLCCNAKGRCGSSDSDCGDGCQSGNCFFALRNSDSDSKAERPTQCGPGLKNPCKDASLCCNAKGRCGSTDSDCGEGCQSGNCYFTRNNNDDSDSKAAQPDQMKSGAMLATKELFERVFPKRNAFYTYGAFRSAVNAFPEFGTTGSSAAQKREVAAFFAHIYYETAGLTQVADLSSSSSSAKTFCLESNPSAKSYSCFPGKKYFARGPLKLTWNYNYGKAGAELGVDLLANPEQLTENAELAFKSALWVWMSSAGEKMPSAHEVMAGPWFPSALDVSANRVRGFGTSIAVLAGRAECGHESDAATARTEKYLQVTKMLNVNAGSNLGCTNMLPF